MMIIILFDYFADLLVVSHNKDVFHKCLHIETSKYSVLIYQSEMKILQEGGMNTYCMCLR